MSLKSAVCKVWGAVKFLVSVVFNIYFVLAIVLYLAVTAAYDRYTTTQQPYKSTVPDNAIVNLNLDSDEMNETSIYGTPASRWANLVKSSRASRYSFSEQVYALQQAATDEKIKGVVVKIRKRQYNAAQAYEITQALLAVRDAGKAVYVYAEGTVTNTELLILSAATERFVAPGTFVRPIRPIYGSTFKRGFYDKFKIDFLGQRVSLYKDLIASDVKYQVDEDSKSIFDTYYQGYLTNFNLVAENYNRPLSDFDLSDEQLLDIFKKYNGNFAEAFTTRGWFDKIISGPDFDNLVAKELGGTKSNAKVPNYVSLSSYTSSLESPLFSNKASKKEPHIAYVAFVGDVVRSGRAPDVISMDNTIRYLRSIYYNANNVDAVVIRVDSPGGSAATGNAVRAAVDDIRSKGIPVVVSQGNLAASAGYMLSSGSDYIYTSPTTITGSIGVVISGYNVYRFYNQFGVNADAVGVNRQFAINAAIPFFVRGYANPYAEEVMALWKAGITNSYHHFISQVLDGRKKHFNSLEEVNRVAQGHVWYGSEALQLKLADAYGNVNDAINKARELILFAQDDRTTDKYSVGEFKKVEIEKLDKLPVIYYNAGYRYSIGGTSLVSRVLSTVDVLTGGSVSSVVGVVNNYFNANNGETAQGKIQAVIDPEFLQQTQAK